MSIPVQTFDLAVHYEASRVALGGQNMCRCCGRKQELNSARTLLCDHHLDSENEVSAQEYPFERASNHAMIQVLRNTSAESRSLLVGSSSLRL